MGDSVASVGDISQQPHFLKCLDNTLAGIETVHALPVFGGVFVQFGLSRQDIDHLQPVAATNIKVIEIMGRGDFDGTGALFHIGILIGNDRDQAIHDRQANHFPHQITITVIIGVNRHRRIPQHGFRPASCNGDEGILHPFNRVFEVPVMAVDLFLLNLKVRNRGHQLGVPVDQPLVTIDQALLMHVDKHLADSVGQAFIHGKTLTRPIG